MSSACCDRNSSRLVVTLIVHLTTQSLNSVGSQNFVPLIWHQKWNECYFLLLSVSLVLILSISHSTVFEKSMIDMGVLDFFPVAKKKPLLCVIPFFPASCHWNRIIYYSTNTVLFHWIYMEHSGDLVIFVFVPFYSEQLSPKLFQNHFICMPLVNNFIVSFLIIKFSSGLLTCSRVHEKCRHFGTQVFLLQRW